MIAYTITKIGKLLVPAIVLLFLLWLLTCWLLARQFLSFGIVDYVESEELALLDGLNIAELERRSVVIKNQDVELAGSLFRHPQPSNCAVILLPGIGGHRTQVLPAMPMFWDIGCHVLAYDPRGTGASSRVDRTFGYMEKHDNALVVEWLAAETGLAPSAIGVWGPSFGAAVGLLTLDIEPDLGFVIADSSFSTFRQVAHETVALITSGALAGLLTPGIVFFLEQRTGLDANSISPAAAIVGTTVPVLLIHAKADPAMPVRHSQAVYAARTTANVSLEVTDWGAGHADSAVVDPTAYASLLHSFLAAHGFAR